MRIQVTPQVTAVLVGSPQHKDVRIACHIEDAHLTLVGWCRGRFTETHHFRRITPPDTGEREVRFWYQGFRVIETPPVEPSMYHPQHLHPWQP